MNRIIEFLIFKQEKLLERKLKNFLKHILGIKKSSFLNSFRSSKAQMKGKIYLIIFFVSTNQKAKFTCVILYKFDNTKSINQLSRVTSLGSAINNYYYSDFNLFYYELLFGLICFTKEKLNL